MPIEIFSVSAQGDAAASEALNRFLAGKRVLSLERSLVQAGPQAFWSFCVEYLEGEPRTGTRNPKMAKRIDYREVLDEKAFGRFAAMRQKRKELAEKEGVPAYAIFTNEQLAAVAQLERASLGAMKEVEGIGEAKAAKYGQAMLEAMGAGDGKNGNGAAQDEADRKPVA